MQKNNPQTDLSIIHKLDRYQLRLCRTFLLLLLAAFLFSGCSEMKRNPAPSATPEDAAIRYAREMKMSNFITNLDSVAAIQKVELNHRVLVLVQLSGIRLIGGAEVCEFVMETDKINFIGWESQGGSGSCHKINDPADTQPITSGSSRSGSSPQDPGYTAVYGIVRDPQIIHVVVTWEDGLVQSVAVQESTYIAVREGGFNIKKVETH